MRAGPAAGAALGLALAVGYGTAPARAAGPQDYMTPEVLRRFQLCRAAVFYHLDDKTRGPSAIPVPVVRTLNEQILLLMQETILNKQVRTVAEGADLVRFVESWFIDFTRVLRDERDTLLDAARRDRILWDCIPFIWVGLAGQVGALLAFRAEQQPATPLPDPAAEIRRMEEAFRALMRP